MFTIIDRYIGKTFLNYFFVTLSVFVTLFLIIDFMVTTSRYGSPLNVYLRFYFYYGFEITYQLLPVACLMSTVFTLSGLNKNSELVAIFSMGWSLWRVCAPILILVSGIGVLSFVLTDQLMTTLIDKKNYVWFVEMKKSPESYLTSKQERIWYRSGSSIFNINLLNSKEGRAFDVTVYSFSNDWHLQQILKAKEGEMTNGQWKFKNGTLTVFWNDNRAPQKTPFTERVLAAGDDMIDIKTSSLASATMSAQELRKYIERNKEAGLNTTAFEVDYYAKFGFAFTAFVMTLLGIPFSVSNNRSGGVLINVQICIMLTVLYWSFYSSGLTLGRYGALPPFLAAWGPNVLIAGFAMYLIRRLKK